MTAGIDREIGIVRTNRDLARLEDSVNRFARMVNDFNDPRFSADCLYLKGAVSHFLQDVNPEVIYTPTVIGDGVVNAMLVDFDPLGTWRWVLTEQGELVYLGQGGEVKKGTDDNWRELGSKFPDAFAREVWLSCTSEVRLRRLAQRPK